MCRNPKGKSEITLSSSETYHFSPRTVTSAQGGTHLGVFGGRAKSAMQTTTQGAVPSL